MDTVSGQKVNLNRVKGVFKYDAWVVPYAMIRRGQVTYINENGKSCTVNVDRDASFSRQG